MRHPSSRALYAIWDRTRGAERAPCRSDLPPDTVRTLLGDIFVFTHDAGSLPMRVAGTRVRAMLGRDCKGVPLPDLFEPASRSEIANIAAEVAEELLVATMGVTAVGHDGLPAPLEMLLLPFRPRAHTPLSTIGLLVPMVTALPPVHALTLASWRYLGHESERNGPRALRKLALGRGMTVYEGLRR